MIKLLSEEARRDPYSQESIDAPKYSTCFLDLAEFLGFKDEVMSKYHQVLNTDLHGAVLHEVS